MPRKDQETVKLGKKEYVPHVRYESTDGTDGGVELHMDFRKPATGIRTVVNATPRAYKPCKPGYHSNRLTYEPKTRTFVCSSCGKDPQKDKKGKKKK